MSERYVIISADGHCGLPLADYRPYLEARFHPAFDEWVGAAKRPSGLPGWRRTSNTSWAGRPPTKRACAARMTRPCATSELDADGVSADVLFADADAITGMGSPPFGAGLAAG